MKESSKETDSDDPKILSAKERRARKVIAKKIIGIHWSQWSFSAWIFYIMSIAAILFGFYISVLFLA